MNDTELERWAEEQEAARDARGGMVVTVCVLLLAVFGVLLLLAVFGVLLLLAGVMASAGVTP